MFLVFDIGGTNTRIATSFDLQTLENTKIIPTEQNFELQIQNMTQEMEELRGEENIEAIAGGVAGSLNLDKSSIINSPNLMEWIQKPLREELEANFDTGVLLENDA